MVQEKLHVIPEYKAIEESGPDHDKRFIVGVYCGKCFIVQGEDYSKKEASINVAAVALEKEFKISTSLELKGKNK